MFKHNLGIHFQGVNAKLHIGTPPHNYIYFITVTYFVLNTSFRL